MNYYNIQYYLMFNAGIILIVLSLLFVMYYFYVSLFYLSSLGKAQKTEPGRHLLVQSHQWKHQGNVRNLFKCNNKDTRTTLMTSFWCLYC